MNRSSKIALGALGVGIAVVVANTAFVKGFQYAISERELSFGDAPAVTIKPGTDAPPDYTQALDPVKAFKELEILDDEAHSWSNQFSVYGGAGVVIFDANGDGRLDIYLPHDGQNWTRPTDATATLMKDPKPQPNTLYLNQGNQSDGTPRFARIDKMMTNDTFVKEELMIEGLLYPRESTSESIRGKGRQSNVPIVADFNGDGLPDVYVGNQTFGHHWSHPKTQRVLSRFVSPVGREARHGKTNLAGLGSYVLDGRVPTEGRNYTRESARGVEPEGANSLFINLGDKDGDGIPEWEDASRKAGVEGTRTTAGLAVADIDLDGDLDLYVANIPDPDFWPGGSKEWSGARNDLYINMLKETGELRFEERATQMGVDTVFTEDYPMPEKWRVKRIPFLAVEYSLAFFTPEAYKPEIMDLDGEVGEAAEISWATIFQDVNGDNYPDLWVANDLGILRLFINKEGKGFEERENPRSKTSGDWMTFGAGDFNGDLKEDLLVGNLGGSFLNHAFVVPDPYAVMEPVMVDSLAFAQFLFGAHDTTHALIDGANIDQELPHHITHSKVLPPDTSIPGNYRQDYHLEYNLHPFEPDTIDPYEFAWGMAVFDAQNDGRQDLYYLGCLYGRGGGLFPITGTAPGRFLVNATPKGGQLAWVDLTAEHQLFDIEELRYDKLESEGYIYRPSPSQNWRKRDMLYSYDRSSWVSQGPGIQERQINQDMIQAAEMGRSVVAGDLNGDGAEDLILTNLGGYDSRSSKARNLRAMIDGRSQVLPAPDFNYPTLTDFAPGRTRTFINTYQSNNWIAIRLVDDTPGQFNRDAIGARVVLNDEQIRIKRAGDGGFIGNTLKDLSFGLGQGVGDTLTITWPDREGSQERVDLGGKHGGLAVISKGKGLIAWEPAPPVAPLAQGVEGLSEDEIQAP